MDYFYIYLALVLISLGTSIASMYGMGAYDHDKNSQFYVMSSVGFNVSLLILSVSSILLIKNSQAAMVCRGDIKPMRKPTAPALPLRSAMKPVEPVPQVRLQPECPRCPEERFRT
jgi:hypothetical protein